MSRQVHNEARRSYHLIFEFTDDFYDVFRAPLGHLMPPFIRHSVREIFLCGKDCAPTRAPAQNTVNKVYFPRLQKVVVKATRMARYYRDIESLNPGCAQIIHYNLDPKSSFGEIENAKHDRWIVGQAKTRVDVCNIQPFTLTPDHTFKLYYEAFVIIHRSLKPFWEHKAEMTILWDYGTKKVVRRGRLTAVQLSVC